MVAIVLVVVGTAGAFGVYFAARAQHRTDRADILRWERVSLPIADEASRVLEAVPRLDTPVKLRSARDMLSIDRFKLVSGSVPDVVKPVTALYAGAIDLAVRSVDAAASAGSTTAREFLKALEDARAAFVSARKAFNDLLCRAELPDCIRQ